MSGKPTSATERLCRCHGEEMRWKKDSRRKAEGSWVCLTRKRELQRAWWAANAELIARKRQEKYDRDWVWRIETNMRAQARRRAATLERRKAADLAERADAHPDRVR